MKTSPDMPAWVVRSRGGLRQTRRFACAAVVAAVTLLGGCGAGAPVVVTPQHVQEYGTALFEAPRDAVFRACVLALRMSGHRIAAAEPSLGLVVAEPDGRLPPGRRPGHGYVVEVRSSPEGRVTVRATPAAADAPDSRGDATPLQPRLDQEREAWELLFADIQTLLDRTNPR